MAAEEAESAAAAMTAVQSLFLYCYSAAVLAQIQTADADAEEAAVTQAVTQAADAAANTVILGHFNFMP